MSYRDRLAPWCIFCLLPHAQRKLVARLRRRSDAEACLKALQRMNPDYDYVLIFDPGDSDKEREIDRPPSSLLLFSCTDTLVGVYGIFHSSFLIPLPSSFCLSK